GGQYVPEWQAIPANQATLTFQNIPAFRGSTCSGISSKYPKEIFIHAKTYFDDQEWQGFSEAVKNKSTIIGIRIQATNEFKLYREFSFCVPRGMAMKVASNKAFLWTKGFIPRLQTQIA
ncbi:hypothetical protein LZG71_29815, partial [Dyadobacter sp. CY312]|nr:hypothetical protein [Dyadobacter sp. CY312]